MHLSSLSEFKWVCKWEVITFISAFLSLSKHVCMSGRVDYNFSVVCTSFCNKMHQSDHKRSSHTKMNGYYDFSSCNFTNPRRWSNEDGLVHILEIDEKIIPVSSVSFRWLYVKCFLMWILTRTLMNSYHSIGISMALQYKHCALKYRFISVNCGLANEQITSVRMKFEISVEISFTSIHKKCESIELYLTARFLCNSNMQFHMNVNQSHSRQADGWIESYAFITVFILMILYWTYIMILSIFFLPRIAPRSVTHKEIYFLQSIILRIHISKCTKKTTNISL